VRDVLNGSMHGRVGDAFTGLAAYEKRSGKRTRLSP